MGSSFGQEAAAGLEEEAAAGLEEEAAAALGLGQEAAALGLEEEALGQEEALAFLRPMAPVNTRSSQVKRVECIWRDMHEIEETGNRYLHILGRASPLHRDPRHILVVVVKYLRGLLGLSKLFDENRHLGIIRGVA